jgi:E2F-associated phosphoprotein
MELDNNHHVGHQQRPQGHSLAFAVVSGDSDSSDGDESSRHEEDIFDDVDEGARTADQTAGEALLRYNPSNPAHDDDMYDQNLDDEDEAYVYRNMRGGLQETIMVRDGSTIATDPNAVTTNAPAVSRPIKMLKPRSSDAVLSCPCCFNIVCMDCQRHQKYLNQFRASECFGIRGARSLPR